MKPLEEARVAIVHEWLGPYGGSEQVVVGMLQVFPQADLYALVHDPKRLRGTPLERTPVRTSFIQSLPKARERYQAYLPLMPLAVEQFDLRPYDLVISSSHAVAKGVLTRADQLHISYTHTPIRYAWDLYLGYLAESNLERGVKSWLARLVLHYVRLWDVSAANRVDVYLANSAYIARRIKKLHRRTARVLHPPVDVGRFRPDLPREEFFVAVCRFVPYKRMNLIVEAFSQMDKPLVVIGDGPEFEHVRRKAGPNVKLLGYQQDETVADYLQRARAFVFAAEEDFGIIPVEAQAAGCPVIAYGKGGVRETVTGFPASDATGVFFDAQTPESLRKAVDFFEEHQAQIRPEACRGNAERFGCERFRGEFRATVEESWSRFQRGEELEE
jgi:glycosyltransferase involved in cell wall biosynthesis